MRSPALAARAAFCLPLVLPLAGCGAGASRVGKPAPAIEIAGWVNGKPKTDALTGHVTVVDFSASW